MSRGERSLLATAALGIGAFVLNATLFVARPAPSRLTLHPVAPPLTYIPAMAERTLGPETRVPHESGLMLALSRVIAATGTTPQREALARIQHPDPEKTRERIAHARELRIAVEQDAIAIAEALGPERTGAIVAAREALGAQYGEERVWATAERALHP